MSSLETTRLGNTGPFVSRLAFGCWAIGGHGWGKANDEESILAVKCAAENGVTFFDTADTYGFGKSEALLVKALGESRNRVVIASKGGVRWNESGKVWRDISPSYLRSAIESSLRRLKLDCIPLYYIHKPDGVTPIQESVASLRRIQDEGKIGAIGLANVTSDELSQALKVGPISAVQIRSNVLELGLGAEVSSICERHGTTVIVWGALADGLLSGKFNPESRFGSDDHRSRAAEFQGLRFQQNLQRVDELKNIAQVRGVTISQLSLRYLLDSIDSSCVIFGAKTESQVRENLGANGWSLTPEEYGAVNRAVGT